LSSAPGTVTTTGSGAAAGVPDSLRLDLAVRCSGQSVSAALARTASGVAVLVEVAHRFTDRERVGSRALQVYPDHDREGRMVGYVAEHRVLVHCDSLDAGGQLVSALGDEVGDVLVVQSVRPVVADPAPLRVEARAAAVADARAVATELAGLAGRSLGEVLTVAEGGAPGPGGFAEPAALRATSFEPGTEDVTATVTVTWALV